MSFKMILTGIERGNNSVAADLPALDSYFSLNTSKYDDDSDMFVAAFSLVANVILVMQFRPSK